MYKKRTDLTCWCYCGGWILLVDAYMVVLQWWLLVIGKKTQTRIKNMRNQKKKIREQEPCILPEALVSAMESDGGPLLQWPVVSRKNHKSGKKKRCEVRNEEEKNDQESYLKQMVQVLAAAEVINFLGKSPFHYKKIPLCR